MWCVYPCYYSSVMYLHSVLWNDIILTTGKEAQYGMLYTLSYLMLYCMHLYIQYSVCMVVLSGTVYTFRVWFIYCYLHRIYCILYGQSKEDHIFYDHDSIVLIMTNIYSILWQYFHIVYGHDKFTSFVQHTSIHQGSIQYTSETSLGRNMVF